MTIPLSRIAAARRLLAAHFDPTPLVAAPSLGTARRTVHLKLETTLPTGSFKVRGALVALSRHADSHGGEVIAASTGNHGAAVAHAARLLHVPATIFLPRHPNQVKAARIRALGAGIVEAGDDLAAAIDAAYEYARRTGAFFLHDATDPDIPAGTGTIGLELVEQQPAVDVIYVPMGDTALVRGLASAAKQIRPSISVVGVAAEGAPAYVRGWTERRPVETASANTIADGLAIRRALDANVADIVELVDRVALVSDEAMLAAIAHLHRHERIVAEPAGAAATAALLADDDAAGACVALVTGCNVTPEVLEAASRMR